eukprot:m.6622 g.6622  ORF g.6622 m.6622 type:complete len:61 (+) comp16420_c0_seq1:249-431(+)
MFTKIYIALLSRKKTVKIGKQNPSGFVGEKATVSSAKLAKHPLSATLYATQFSTLFATLK